MEVYASKYETSFVSKSTNIYLKIGKILICVLPCVHRSHYLQSIIKGIIHRGQPLISNSLRGLELNSIS